MSDHSQPALVDHVVVFTTERGHVAAVGPVTHDQGAEYVHAHPEYWADGVHWFVTPLAPVTADGYEVLPGSPIEEEIEASSLGTPESLRTVHVRVTYRMQIPVDIPLIRCQVDRKVQLPPMRYSTGAPGPDGTKGTWATHPLPGDFLTYQEEWGEADGFLGQERDRLRAEIAYRDMSWRDWQAKISDAGHSMEVGDTPHPGDTAAVWCDAATCELPEGSNPDWPCPGLLADLGLDADGFERVDKVHADKQGADQLGAFVDRTFEAEGQRDRARDVAIALEQELAERDRQDSVRRPSRPDPEGRRRETRGELEAAVIPGAWKDRE